MSLEECLLKIKTGNREEIKLAKKKLEKLWNEHYQNKRWRKNLVQLYIAELENFDKMTYESNQLAFIYSLRWPFMEADEKEEWFLAFRNFILKIIQNPAGHLRYAIFHAADWLILPLSLSMDSQRWHENVNQQVVENHKRWFGEFVEEVEKLRDRYSSKKLERYKYIGNMPAGICKSIEFLLNQLLKGEFLEGIYEEYQMKKAGFEPIGAIDNFEIPKWWECGWSRMPCNKMDCRLCGKIMRDRQRHIEKGEDLNDWKVVMEDVGNSLEEALAMIKKDAEARGIEITNIKDDWIPPKPEKFPLYKRVAQWREMIHKIAQAAADSGSLWLDTVAAADLMWYKNTLTAKTYRQLVNRWELKKGDRYGDIDYKYTKYVLEECMKILKKSLAELSLLNSLQKAELILALSELSKLEKQILKI